LGKELGKDCLKKLQNARKCLQTASTRRGRFLLLIQKVAKSFEEDKKAEIRF
jgi:hypothetical protein